MKKIELESKIKKAQEAYYNGSEIISDDEYDALIYELSNLDPKNKLLSKVGAKPTEEWTKERHIYPLGSLNKLNSSQEMEKWISEKLNGKQTVVIEKLDGLSIGCQYDNGKLVKSVLRGDGFEGENIFTNVVKMKDVVLNLKNNFTGLVRGEIILKKSDHKVHFETYSNPRNASSGLCRKLDGEGCEHLSLMFYQAVGDVEFSSENEMLEWLKENSFIVPNYKLCKSSEEINEFYQEYQNSKRDQLDYEIDGLVINCNDLKIQKSMGETNLRPKGKIAFKFANQFIKTKVKSIDWTIGKMGRITPVSWFDPVNLLGSNIQKASVYNIAYINELKLNVGAEILVCKANEIIPRVEKVLRGSESPAKHPENCPSCSGPLEIEGEFLLCPNSLSCPSQVQGRIHNWINELNLLEWGKTLIERLVESGKVSSVPDLYDLTQSDLESLERMGKKSAKKCLDILWNLTELPLEIMLGGLSIPLIGSSSIKLIMAAGIDTLEKIQKASLTDFEAVSGIGPGRAKSLFDGLKKNEEIIGKLLKAGIKVKEKKIMEKTDGKFSGKTFVITGTLSRKREEIEADIEGAGGKISGSVSKTTHFLVIADPSSTSSKAQKARSFGTKLISEDELMEMLA